MYGKDNLENRQKWVSEQLGAIASGETILDVGAGECQYKQYCAHLSYVAQDIAEYDGKGDAEGLHTNEWNTSQINIVCDILEFPKDMGPYDNVLCTEVLEHVQDPVKAFNKICDLVKIGGTLYFTAPFGSLTHFAPYHYATGFNKYFYKHYLASNGFEIIELSANGNYYKVIAQELYRISSMFGQNRSKYIRAVLHYGCILPLIKVIQYMDKKSNSEDSEALCCYGYHVKAKKIR